MTRFVCRYDTILGGDDRSNGQDTIVDDRLSRTERADSFRTIGVGTPPAQRRRRMSKKHLARTAIEGGRSHYNQLERRASHTCERQAARAFCHLARVSNEDELPAAPRRRPVRKDFSDKLAPVYRWLDRQIGRPWDGVYAEIRARFDGRTTAGRHILFCHLLAEVDRFGEVRQPWRRFDLVVNDRGMLQAAPDYAGRGRRRRLRHPQPRWAICSCTMRAWAAGRKIGLRAAVAFWFLPVEGVDAVAYRQGARLTAAEVAVWNALAADRRAEIQMVLDGRGPVASERARKRRLSGPKRPRPGAAPA
jgi:hypothetical protein